MTRAADLEICGAAIRYAEDPARQAFDPCYGAKYPDGTVVVYPNVNGNPAFMPEVETRTNGPDTPAKGHVFDTQLTRTIMKEAGFDVNVWSIPEGQWVTE